MSSKRQAAREEARFMKGEVGVDGSSGKEEVDAAEAEQAKAREALFRGRTWLGREALTWLLWKSESTEPITSLDGKPVSVVFNGKLTLRAGAGDVTELAVKGVSSPYSKLVKRSLSRGILVHGAKLQVTWNEQVFDVTLDAEFFDARAGKLPELLQEEEGERLTERLELASRLSALLEALTAAFIKERTAKGWASKTVPALREWMGEV